MTTINLPLASVENHPLLSRKLEGDPLQPTSNTYMTSPSSTKCTRSPEINNIYNRYEQYSPLIPLFLPNERLKNFGKSFNGLF
jgi:hypothetical protein